MSRLPIVLTCLLLPLAAAAAEPEGRSIPYQKLYEPLAAVRKADPDGIVTSSLRAEPATDGQPLPDGLKIELRHGAAHDPVAVGADGRFDLPLHADWTSTDASLWLNQPKTVVKVVENFSMRTPRSTHLTYAQLMESVPVIERIRAQHVDIHGLLASTPAGVELAFEPGSPQKVTVGTGSAAKSFAPDGEGLVKVPWDASLPASTPVELTALPSALLPYSN